MSQRTPWRRSSASSRARSAQVTAAVLSDIIPAMRALQITGLPGPDGALALVELPDPEPSHVLTPGSGVVVDVHCAGVSFPELLQTRGEYQLKPELPFLPGSDV